MNTSHESENLSKEIEEFCTKWGIALSKVSLALTDNAANITLAVKNLFGPNKIVPCFDHTLNLVSKYALGCKTVAGEEIPWVPGVPELMKKVKKLVAFSHSSYNFANALRQVQVDKYGKSGGTWLRLVQEEPTRWGSA